MMLLLSLFTSLAFAAGPSGNYRGEENILGMDIVATMNFDKAGHTNFTITGPVTIQCPVEPYTMSGNNIELTNAGVAGDCVHDALAQEKVTLNSIVYDPSSDGITVSVKYSFFNLKLSLTKTSFGGAACGSDCETSTEVGKLDGANGPSGTYKGAKTILGMQIDATVENIDSTHMNMKITGAVAVDCSNEEYSYSNGAITISGFAAGDCIHDAMADAGVTLKGITYDPDTDVITVEVKKLFITATLELSHVSENKVDRWALADPAGTYKGSKTILGMQIDATVVEADSTHMNMKITGAFPVDCENEVYSYSNGVITVPGADTAGDCIHDALDESGVTLKGITYDADNDVITVSVKKLFVTATLELSHVSELVAPVEPTVERPFKILTTKINPFYLEKLKASRAEEN